MAQAQASGSPRNYGMISYSSPNKILKIETLNPSVYYTFCSYSDETLAEQEASSNEMPSISIDVESLYNNYNKGLDIEFSCYLPYGQCTYIIPYDSITQISLQIITDPSNYHYPQQEQGDH